MLKMIQNASSYIPLLLVGPPGIGKTDIVRSNFDYTEVMLASTMVEEDIAGLPYREGEYDYRTIPSMFRNLSEASNQGKTTCLFLDELDKSRRAVADTLLTLVASRKVGKAELPSGTVVIAAANPPEFGGGDGISDAMRSRFCVVDAEPCISGWTKWARDNFRSERSHAVINAVEMGHIPLIDYAGEEMQKRITCPRTIAMMLRYIEASKEIDDSVLGNLTTGLFTQNTASRFMLSIRQASARDTDVVDKSHSVRTSSKETSKKPPIRL